MDGTDLELRDKEEYVLIITFSFTVKTDDFTNTKSLFLNFTQRFILG